MVNIELRDKFKKEVYKFFRDENLTKEDISELLKQQFEFYATDHTKEGKSWLDFKKKMPESTLKDFREMWEGFVQQSIDFINAHEEVKNVIEEERQELIEEWNPNAKDDEFKMLPDLRISFGADGLDESVKAGKWVAATDSGICLRIGSRNIIEMM